MRKLITISDLHLGLSTDGVSRNKEIVQVFKKMKVKSKYPIDVVICGDIFDTNVPSESDIAAFIYIINLLNKFVTGKMFVVMGNHESISVVGRLSCLTFVRELAKEYKNLKLIDDICASKVCDSDVGPYYYVFLPHINNAHIAKKKYKNTQDYIESKAKRTLEKIGKHAQYIVFSHLNIKGVIAGDEENLLNKSKVFLPDFLSSQDMMPLGYTMPTNIISGHIHAAQVLRNIQVVGSPIFTDFSDVKDKSKRYYLDGEIGPKGDFKYDMVDTKCRRFINYEITPDDGISLSKHIDKITKKVAKIKRKTFFKIDATIHENHNNIKWSDVVKSLTELNPKVTIKPVVPKIVHIRTRRNPNQTKDLSIKKAIRTYVKKYELANEKRIISRAMEYVEKAGIVR